MSLKRVEYVSKMSWGSVNSNSLTWWYILKTSWRCFEDIFPRRLGKTSWRCLEDVFGHVFKTSKRHFENISPSGILKTSWRLRWIYSFWSRHLEDVLIKTNVFWEKARCKWNCPNKSSILLSFSELFIPVIVFFMPIDAEKMGRITDDKPNEDNCCY